MKKIVILPTYQEKENCEKIYKLIRKYNSKISILFVDDNSPDGTGKIIKNLKKKDRSLFLEVRKKKKGIGSAHKYGIRWALKKNFKIIVTMDADLTHNPKIIPKMLSLTEKFDLIQTNRFLMKDSIKDWTLLRKLMTNIRFILIKYLLGMEYDTSGAFRCYNFNKINPKHLLETKDDSYSFFWESIFLLNERKYTIFELPIKLPKRVSGYSKMNTSDWISGVIHLLAIFAKYKVLNKK